MTTQQGNQYQGGDGGDPNQDRRGRRNRRSQQGGDAELTKSIKDLDKRIDELTKAMQKVAGQSGPVATSPSGSGAPPVATGGMRSGGMGRALGVLGKAMPVIGGAMQIAEFGMMASMMGGGGFGEQPAGGGGAGSGGDMGAFVQAAQKASNAIRQISYELQNVAVASHTSAVGLAQFQYRMGMRGVSNASGAAASVSGRRGNVMMGIMSGQGGGGAFRGAALAGIGADAVLNSGPEEWMTRAIEKLRERPDDWQVKAGVRMMLGDEGFHAAKEASLLNKTVTDHLASLVKINEKQLADQQKQLATEQRYIKAVEYQTDTVKGMAKTLTAAQRNPLQMAIAEARLQRAHLDMPFQIGRAKFVEPAEVKELLKERVGMARREHLIKGLFGVSWEDAEGWQRDEVMEKYGEAHAHIEQMKSTPSYIGKDIASRLRSSGGLAVSGLAWGLSGLAAPFRTGSGDQRKMTAVEKQLRDMGKGWYQYAMFEAIDAQESRGMFRDVSMGYSREEALQDLKDRGWDPVAEYDQQSEGLRILPAGYNANDRTLSIRLQDGMEVDMLTNGQRIAQTDGRMPQSIQIATASPTVTPRAGGR